MLQQIITLLSALASIKFATTLVREGMANSLSVNHLKPNKRLKELKNNLMRESKGKALLRI
jgi:hypothetical protein